MEADIAALPTSAEISVSYVTSAYGHGLVTAMFALPTSAEISVGYVSSEYADVTFVKSS
jgi:hypothetical protein